MAQQRRAVDTKPASRRGPSPARPTRLALLHDLHVHQEEIEAQNQQLLAAQIALEETRDRYIELYDFAPNGYLTVDRFGVVLEINLTGTAMLGTRRERTVGAPLVGYVSKGHRGEFLEFMRRCRTHRGGIEPSVELEMRTGNGLRFVELHCRPRVNAAGRPEFLLAMLDIGERKALEKTRQVAAAEHAKLVGRLLSVQEDERRRIARDIHDHLGQQCTGLRLKLELLAQEVPPGQLQQRLQEAQQLADALDASLDFFTGKLRPTVLDDVGLVAALGQLVREWSSNFGIAADFHSSGLDGVRLAADVETHLYRFCQEALNNVYKHAGASHAAVMLERRGGRLLLIIEDDGRGLPLQAVTGPGHNGLGLIGMHERAALVGGQVQIESGKGRGTSVYLQLAWPSPPAAAARPPARKRRTRTRAPSQHR